MIKPLPDAGGSCSVRASRELSASEDGTLGSARLGTGFPPRLHARAARPTPRPGPERRAARSAARTRTAPCSASPTPTSTSPPNLRAGGRVIHGEPFDRFGITEALGHDADDHGADGSHDVTGNLLRTGAPVRHPRHPRLADVRGLADQRHEHPPADLLLVARSGPGWRACGSSSPRRSRTSRSAGSSRCARTPATRRDTIKLEVRRAARACRTTSTPRAAGPAEGWFRLVDSPRQARRVIEQGKLAVVIGVESSNPFGCSERRRTAGTQRRRPRPRSSQRLGVRSAVHRPLGRQRASPARRSRAATKGVFINVFNQRRDRPLLQHRPLPRPEPGRGGEHAQPGRDADPRPVLPGRRRDPADAGLPRGQAVQLQGPDASSAPTWSSG